MWYVFLFDSQIFPIYFPELFPELLSPSYFPPVFFPFFFHLLPSQIRQTSDPITSL